MSLCSLRMPNKYKHFSVFLTSAFLFAFNTYPHTQTHLPTHSGKSHLREKCSVLEHSAGFFLHFLHYKPNMTEGTKVSSFSLFTLYLSHSLFFWVICLSDVITQSELISVVSRSDLNSQKLFSHSWRCISRPVSSTFFWVTPSEPNLVVL